MPDHHVLTADFLPQSDLPGLAFPSFPSGQRALMLALLAQLAETQWWSPERLREHQLAQLAVLVRHAARTTRYGRQAFPDLAKGSLTWKRWSSLPLLSRRQVQSKRRALISDATPKEHGTGGSAQTSGSTGTPVVVERTEIPLIVWQVLTARDHLWARRDTTLPLAVIRHAPGAEFPKGQRTPSWGPAAKLIGPPGPCDVLHVGATTEQQLDWLLQRRFGYLLLYPSGLRDLLKAARRRAVRFPDLRAVRTFGEVVSPELREQVQAQWGVPLEDMYSTQELGYIALQCPEHPHYHVLSESVLVEILRDDGTPCEVGEVGRVVLTGLHNFKMPLLRYDIGDFGVFGPPCACGRGLPVIERILGRVHETFVTAEGDRIWLTVGIHRLPDLAPIVQHQLVQQEAGQLELRLVPERTPTPAEEEAVRQHMLENLPAKTRFSLTWVDEIPRSASGKSFDFLSLIG
ncbi:MAG: phenylacetate--CoA ligase family protein [Deltaproteobacteria bacterium]|nr:phenylacetate--CoA ligase family protein [Deltaproteobacteria bacterium]